MVETGAFYYPWYDKNRHWQEGKIQTPLLGEYSSQDPKIIDKHIFWAKKAKIDFFVASWWGQDSFENKTLTKYLDPACSANDFKYCLLYETSGKLNPRNLSSDFDYFCNTLFTSPNFYQINGRPVVFLYLSRIFEGDIQETISTLRNNCHQYGFDPYLIGDEVYWGVNPSSLPNTKTYDALSLYNPHVSVQDILENFWSLLPKLYETWEQYTAANKIDFIPTLIPGFDDSATRPESEHPTLPRNKQNFIELLNKYRHNKKIKHLLICSWNEWHENTQVEPSREENILGL